MKKLYSWIGPGRWVERTWAKQCPETGLCLLGGRCQGIEGHKDIHWCYDSDGTFNWAANESEKKLKDTDVAGGSMPPGHPSYTHPKKMMRCYYMRFHTDIEITDKKLIAKFEAGFIPRNASITAPVGVIKRRKRRKK